MVNCHIKKYLIIFFVLIQGAVAFSCASDDEVLEVVDLSVNKWWISKVKPERKI